MAFYRKPPWWCRQLGVQYCNRHWTFYFWHWVWEPGRPAPEFGDCLLGVLYGYKPTKKFLEITKPMARLFSSAGRIAKQEVTHEPDQG